MAEMTGIFAAANNTTQEIKDVVLRRQAEAIAKADASRLSALSVIQDMGAFTPRLTLNGSVPVAPVLVANITGNLNLPELGADSFGTITPIVSQNPPTFQVGAMEPINIDGFQPSFANVNVPDAPVAGDFGPLPTVPDIGDITLPTVPLLERPALPDLVDVVIPDYTFPVLSQFTAKSPEFKDTAVSAVLQWSETPYVVSILTDEMAKLRQMWDGGTGLPLAVEKALWERAASREDIAISRDVSAATTEFAGRGFTMPPGMLVARIDSIREDGQIRKLGLGREVLVKIADTQIENVRFACTQAVASENVLLSVWNTISGRQFDAAKVQIDSQLSLANMQVAIFNARQQAYATEATIYRAKLDGDLAGIQVYRAQIDGQIAKGTINQQRVSVYSEMVRALLSDLEVYKAQMEGVKIEGDVQRNRIDAYKVQIEAYAAVVAADKTRFDVYESQMKGEAAKVNLVEAQARGYAAYVSGQAAKADINIKNQQAEIATAELELRSYTARLERDKALMQSQSASISANAEAHRTNTQRFVAQAGAQTTAVELQIKATEANMRNSIAIFDVQLRKYTADMEQMIRVASIQLEALKSAAQATSTLAAGAMAGISMGSDIRASASVGASGAENTTIAL